MRLSEIQLGKNGVTDNFILTIKGSFQKHNQVRISVLKSAGHTKEQVKEYADKILTFFDERYTAKIIGFKIILKRWRTPKR